MPKFICFVFVRCNRSNYKYANKSNKQNSNNKKYLLLNEKWFVMLLSVATSAPSQCPTFLFPICTAKNIVWNKQTKKMFLKKNKMKHTKTAATTTTIHRHNLSIATGELEMNVNYNKKWAIENPHTQTYNMQKSSKAATLCGKLTLFSTNFFTACTYFNSGEATKQPIVPTIHNRGDVVVVIVKIHITS